MRLIVRCAVLFVLSMVLLVVSGYAADFSADIVSKTPEHSFTGKFYVSGDKSRIEMTEGVTISRMDKKVVWVLMPQQGMYMEQPLEPRSAVSTHDVARNRGQASTLDIN